MERRIHYYVSHKNVLTWLMALCLVCSAVTRIVTAGMKGTDGSLQVWCQIILPIAASLFYVLITLLDGREHFYKTAIPVWMIAFYFGFTITTFNFGKMVTALYWVVLFFFAAVYTEVTAGKHGRPSWILFFLYISSIAAVLYLNRELLLQQNWAKLETTLSDILMLVGLLLLVFSIRIHPLGAFHPTWGDRVDGRRLRSLTPMSQVSPYIMVSRNTAANCFEDSFEISHIDRYVRQKRKEGLTNFGITHVLLAAYCRGLARYPGLNRFISGQKIYSKGEDIQFCMTIKKEMTADSPDTIVKVHLSPRDTAMDVYNKLNDAIENVKSTPLDSSFDHTAHAFMMIPGIFLKFTVWLLKMMDYFGLIPAFLLEVSPFHGSIFFTSMGSLGIPPVYHHLYDFGNLPIFGSFGCKRKAAEIQEDGTVVMRKYMDVKFSLDERIVDGFYFAAFFKHYKRILRHPEILDETPEEIVADID